MSSLSTGVASFSPYLAHPRRFDLASSSPTESPDREKNDIQRVSVFLTVPLPSRITLRHKHIGLRILPKVSARNTYCSRT